MKSLRNLVTAGLVCMGCGLPRDPNGAWSTADAGLYFFDSNDASFWDGRNLYLLTHGLVLLSQDCRELTLVGGRLKAEAPKYPPINTVQVTHGEVRLLLDGEKFSIDEGYRIRHRDAGLVGLVRLSFDAGFDFETDDRAAFRWQADYSDDVKHLQTEGGELWFERAPFECR